MPSSVVLLGASNVQMGAGGLIAAALRAAGSTEAQVLVAAGHGRSYGEWSRAGLRALPGIVDCGLWPALAARGVEGGIAVLTDVGNDLAYGAPAARLAGWIETCVERLRGRGMAVVVSRFPGSSVARLGWLRFRVLRAMFFPSRRFSLAEILAEGAELNERLERFAAAAGASCVSLSAEWYGLDRIHLRPGRRELAWAALLEQLRGDGRTTNVPPVGLRGARAELSTILGFERHCAQPCVRLDSGTTLSFF